MVISKNHHKPMAALSLLQCGENISDFSAQFKIRSEQIAEGQKGLLPGAGEATMRVRDAYLDRAIKMEMVDDISLLTAIADRRDHAAFADLCERYRKRAFNLALRVLRNSTAAEDAVQEAMLAVWLSAGSFEADRANAQTWILSIVINKCINLGTAQRQREKREERLAMERSCVEAPSVDGIEDHELIATLRSHLDQLPELDGKILACCYGANMTHQKTAEFLGLPRRTVTDKIQRALDSLRGSLAKAGVAAVVPLLSAENLFEAMTSGRDCPPGMSERILHRIKNSGKNANSASRRTFSAKRGATTVLAIGSIVLVAAGIVLGRAYYAAPSGTSTLLDKSAVSSQADKPLHMHWSFEKGPAGELRVFQGNWTWQFSDEKKSGFMATPPVDLVGLRLPVKLPAQPIMIRTEEFLTSEGEFAMSALPVHDERVQPTVMWRTFVEFRGTTLANLSTTHVTEIFILDRYIVQKLDGQFQEVRELQRPYSIDALALVIRRWSMLSIDLKSIEPTELPSELKDIPALIKRMKEGPTHENADNQKVPVAGH